MNHRKYSGLRRRIEKLEAAAGKGPKHCPYCRLHYRHAPSVGPDYQVPEAGDLIALRCQFCHARYLFASPSGDETYREMYRLKSSFTLKDTYTDPRAKALEVWWRIKYSDGRAARYGGPEGAVKRDRSARTVFNLKEEVENLFRRKTRQLQARYGPRSFSEIGDMMRSIRRRPSRVDETGLHVPKLAGLEREEYQHLTLAELEKLIRGEPFPETTAALEGVRLRISEAIEAARQDEARRKEDIRRHEGKACRSANHEREAEAKWVGDPRFQMAQVDE